MLFHNWRHKKTETSSVFARLFTLFFTKFKLITVIIARLHSWLNERSLLLSSLLYIINLYQHLNFHLMPIKNGSVILLSVNIKYSDNKNEIARNISNLKYCWHGNIWSYILVHIPNGDVINSLLEKWAITPNLRSS